MERADFSAGELDANEPLGEIVHTSRASVTELLEIHLSAILACVRGNAVHFVNYPVSIIQSSPCCKPEAWKVKHRDDLLRLSMRGSIDRQISPEMPLPVDLSLGRDHSLFANMGSAVYMKWEGEAPKSISELDTVLVFEHALLLYMRLHSLEQKVTNGPLRASELRLRNRDAIELFSELRQRDLRFGEARDIARHVLEDLGASDIRRTIEVALDLSASAYGVLSAERAATRAWWVTLAATVLAFVLAIQPIGSLIQSASTDVNVTGLPKMAFVHLQTLGFWAPWAVLSTMVLATGVARVIASLFRREDKPSRSKRRGYKWPTEFVIDSSNYSPAHSGESGVHFKAHLDGESEED